MQEKHSHPLKMIYFINYVYVCVCMCASECGLAYVSAMPMKPERTLRSLGAGVTGTCELPLYQIVLWESST